MSVTDEITRIQTAKENLKTSINAKLSDSQTKISDELISEYSTFVDSIEQGGGSDYNVKVGLLSSKPLYQGISEVNLTSYPLFANSYSLFSNLSSLTTIIGLDTTGVTNMDSMFNGCSSLTTIPQLNTSSVTSMSSMFYGCYKLTTVPTLDLSSCENTQYMFRECYIIETVSLTNTSKITNTGGMFYNCLKLISVPDLDLSSVTTASQMFSTCRLLETVPSFNIPKATNMSNMFQYCDSLSDESLNNILETCITAISSPTKTLKYIGLTSTQATKCQSLSNYEAFTNTGWTTGY